MNNFTISCIAQSIPGFTITCTLRKHQEQKYYKAKTNLFLRIISIIFIYNINEIKKINLINLFNFNLQYE